MNNRPVVCDADGILVSYNDPFRDLLGSFGSPLENFESPDNPRVWAWYSAYGATPEQVKLALAYTANHPEWWGRLPRHRDFTDEATSLLCELIRTEDVYVCTARPHGTRKVSQTWLGFWLTYSDMAKTNILDTPSVVVTPTRKVHSLTAIEPKAIIEDNLDTLQQYRVAMEYWDLPDCELILVDRAYNRGDRTGVTVVNSTAEALTRVKELQ